MMGKEKSERKKKPALFEHNVLCIMLLLQGLQTLCPKYHTAVSGELLEMLPARLRKQALCFYGNLSLIQGSSHYSDLQTDKI